MAEAIARHYFGEWFDVASAGSFPNPIRPQTLAVIKELGIATDALYPKHVDQFRSQSFDYVITLCEGGQACPLPPQHTFHLHAPMPDPIAATGTSEEVLDQFRKVRDAIREYIVQIFPTLNHPLH